MRHSGMSIQVLVLGWNLCFSSTFTVWPYAPFGPRKTLVSNCIDCLQLHKRPINQTSLLSRQDHDGVRLNWKQFRRTKKRGTKCKYFFKIKSNKMHQWRGGFQHILNFMDIHISILLWIKPLHLQTSGDKINLKNTKKLQNNNIMKNCE